MNRDGWLVAVWSLLILLLVVPWSGFADHSHWQRVAWLPFAAPADVPGDAARNFLLYVPWGYFLARAKQWSRSLAVVGALALTLSLSTEATQLYSHGRFPSATDVVCNTLGALAGALIVRRRRSAHGV